MYTNFSKNIHELPEDMHELPKKIFKEYCYEFSDLWHTPVTGGLQ